MNQAISGYLEIEHTADWELKIWAPNLYGLLEQAAIGMYALSGAKLADGPRIERSFKMQFLDPESLLVEFLSELLYFVESEKLAFSHFALQIIDDSLQANLIGAPLAHLDKEIKAVTYHNLLSKQTDRGLETRIVFDV